MRCISLTLSCPDRLAELHGAQGDLNIVMEAAERHGYRSVVKNCERILGRAHIRTTP